MQQKIALAALLAFLVGCSSSLEPGHAEMKHQANSNQKTIVKRFTIGNTEFGIDLAASSFDVDTSGAEGPTITIEIAGDRSTFDPLTVDDDAEWSWALHPPAFYLRGFPLTKADSNDAMLAHVKRDDVEDYEFSIYMMEHTSD